MNIFGYDFEVFQFDWTVTFLQVDTKKSKENNLVILNKIQIVNDVEKLRDFTNLYKDNSLFVGFNNSGYDKYIWDSILNEWNPFYLSQQIIHEKQKPWKVYQRFRYQLINYDVLVALHNKKSLKFLEGCRGSKIHESSVAWDINRPLTNQEIEETLDYNYDDVYNTLQLFFVTFKTFESQLWLINHFQLPLKELESTAANLTAKILGAEKQLLWQNEVVPGILDRDYYEVPKTLSLQKYHFLIDFFGNDLSLIPSKKDSVFIICQVIHIYGLGGLHGSQDGTYWEGILVFLDWEGYYPGLLRAFGWLSRSVKEPNRFYDIMDKRKEAKTRGDKKMSNALKLIVNTVTGATKATFNALYDPRMNQQMVVSGQLFITMMIELLEPVLLKNGVSYLMQSNTDGIGFKLVDLNDWPFVLQVKAFMEQVTGVKIEASFGTRMWQKDVNNYIFENSDGSLKLKGAYVKNRELDSKDPQIINQAIVNYFVKGISLQETICNPDNALIDYQQITSFGTTYNDCYHFYNQEYHQVQRVNRVFATKQSTYGTVYKKKASKNTYEKIASVPDHAFIYNDDVTSLKAKDFNLDYDFYLNQAAKKINDFMKEKP